jgi:hypothetical protein
MNNFSGKPSFGRLTEEQVKHLVKKEIIAEPTKGEVILIRFDKDVPLKREFMFQAQTYFTPLELSYLDEAKSELVYEI